MGEANRRAIAQGFDDAEHRRLHLSVEQMRKENTRNSDAAARVRHYKVQDNVETDYTDGYYASNTVAITKADYVAEYESKPIKPMAMGDTVTYEGETLRVCAVTELVEGWANRLTTKKIEAGLYEVKRNRDHVTFVITKEPSGAWTIGGIQKAYKTLAAAKAAIPA